MIDLSPILGDYTPTIDVSGITAIDIPYISRFIVFLLLLYWFMRVLNTVLEGLIHRFLKGRF